MRCKGYVRTGGAFTLGPVKWEQCNHDAVVILTINYGDGPHEKYPACAGCWDNVRKGLDPNSKLVDAEPITSEEGD